MNATTDLKALRIFLRVYGVLFLLIFSILSVLFLLRAPIVNPGHALHWLIWDDVEGHVGPMLFVIYLTWGVFLLLAAREPRRYASFLTFTLWANLLHGLLMVPQALGSPMYHSKFLTDIPFLLILALGLYLLRPRATNYDEAAQTRAQSSDVVPA